MMLSCEVSAADRRVARGAADRPDRADAALGTLEARHRAAITRGLLPQGSAAGFSEAVLRHRLIFMPCVPGREILLPGDVPDCLFATGQGAIKTVMWTATGRRLTVQIAKPGQLVGLNSLGVRGSTSRFGAVPQTKGTVVAVSRDLVRELIERQPAERCVRMIAAHTRVLARLVEHVCELIGRTVTERLRHCLDQLAAAFPAPDARHGVDPRLGLRHQDLAEMVASTRSTVTRALTDARRRSSDVAAAPANGVGTVSPMRGRSEPQPSPAADLGPTFRHDLEIARAALGLSAATCRVLAEHVRLHRYRRGERIALDDARYGSVLVRGAARVDCVTSGGREIGVAIVGPARCLGAGFIDRGKQAGPTFRAVALRPCVVATLSPDVLARVVATMQPDELMRWVGHCHEALVACLYDKCTALSTSLGEGLLHQLQRLADEFPDPHPRGTVIRLDLSDGRRAAPRTLAAFLGATMSSLSRAFSALVHAGRVGWVDGRILVVGYRAAEHTV